MLFSALREKQVKQWHRLGKKKEGELSTLRGIASISEKEVFFCHGPQN